MLIIGFIILCSVPGFCIYLASAKGNYTIEEVEKANGGQ